MMRSFSVCSAHISPSTAARMSSSVAFRLNQYKIQNYKDAYKLIFEYIETFYNTVRIHSHCNYESPNQYEKSYVKSN
ncbi:IS3 family transposase [Catenibacterium mitsuokai]|uniref:IS3 family transposase n=2 Tax=Catenibacterium mitsuokai TaxID=100886 RepID=UPI003F90F6F4